MDCFFLVSFLRILERPRDERTPVGFFGESVGLKFQSPQGTLPLFHLSLETKG